MLHAPPEGTGGGSERQKGRVMKIKSCYKRTAKASKREGRKDRANGYSVKIVGRESSTGIRRKK